MKKTIMSVAVAAAALLSFNAFAQQPTPCVNAEQCAPQNCGPAPCYGTPACGPFQCDSLGRPQRTTPFDGLNLTDQQKQQVQQLCQKYAPATPEQRRQALINERKQYLAELKQILTPEQYTQFLESSFVNRGNGFNKGHRPGFGKGPKAFKQCKKDDGKDRKDKKDNKKDNKDKKDKK